MRFFYQFPNFLYFYINIARIFAHLHDFVLCQLPHFLYFCTNFFYTLHEIALAKRAAFLAHLHKLLPACRRTFSSLWETLWQFVSSFFARLHSFPRLFLMWLQLFPSISFLFLLLFLFVMFLFLQRFSLISFMLLQCFSLVILISP